jgi:hypothetical protein
MREMSPHGSSFQRTKKIAGLNNANIPEGFQLSEMAIARYDEVGPAG